MKNNIQLVSYILRTHGNDIVNVDKHVGIIMTLNQFQELEL
jgi:hypothetical protein